MSPAITFLVQAMIIIGLPPILWHSTPVKRVLPLAVIQIIAGIALGPSLLGRVWPSLFDSLFPPTTVIALSTIANFAVILFAFTIGAHLDLSALRGRGRAFLSISVGAVAVPTLLGTAAGWYISVAFPQTIGAHATRTDFALAIGICVGVTALPVLGAILREMGLLGQRIGQLALRCAVVNDAALWILLALLLTYMMQHGRDGSAVWRLAGGGTIYIVMMAFAVRPILTRLAGNAPFGDRHLVLLSVMAIASAAATELLGLHYVLGAFVAGVAVPDDWRRPVLARLEGVAATLLLPFFFITMGLRVRIDPFADEFSTIVVATMIAALVGKIAGTAIPARLSGEKWGDAFALGALMQAKGLVVFVALTILLDSEVIDLTVFSALVVMAVVNDMLCMPLVRLGLARSADRSSQALPYQLPVP
jgi:Kef-type K+ transport system membrane component KefB